MKSFLFVMMACSFLTVNGQKKNTVEIAATLNSVDPLIPLGNYYFAVPSNSGVGSYADKSIAMGILAKYFIAENFALRFKTIYTRRNLTYHNETSGTNNSSVFDVRNNQTLYKIAPGIQWTYFQKKVAFFAGMELPVCFQGTMTERTISIQNTVSQNSQNNLTYDIPGGTSFGLGLFMGSNFYVCKKLALGFELGTAYEKNHISGELVRHSVVTGSNPNESTGKTDASVTLTKFSNLQAGFTLTLQLN